MSLHGMRRATSQCGICGASIESRVPADWHPSKLERRAQWDLQEHVRGHSFAEILRFEIRRDLSQVPAEDRATLIRDLYRQLLGTVEDGQFRLGDEDGVGRYSIAEALGTVALYRLWHAALRCGDPRCRDH